MQIIHKIDDFLFTIFPELTEEKVDNEFIVHTLEDYYTYGPYKPKVTIEKDWVTIEIDTPTILSQEADYRKVVSLCEKRMRKSCSGLIFKRSESLCRKSRSHLNHGSLTRWMCCCTCALRLKAATKFLFLQKTGSLYV